MESTHRLPACGSRHSARGSRSSKASPFAPVLIALGFNVYEVAPATLAATFLTSIVGIATYQVLQLSHGGAIAPEWVLGAFLGAGGFAGSYCGARLQSRLPEGGLRLLLGCVACLVAARYFEMAATGTARPPKALPHSRLSRGLSVESG